MSTAAPEAPAWAGFEPDPADWQPAPAAADMLCRLLHRRGRLSARSRGQRLRGFYQLHAEDGGPDLFLKVVSSNRLDTLLAADRVAAWLARQDMNIPHLAAAPIELPDGDRLLSQTLLAGRFARPTVSDLAALGGMLAGLHSKLASLPQGNAIRRASLERDQALLAARGDEDSFAGLSYRPDEVRACIAAHGPDLPRSDAQPLHGDLNLGNVLFLSPGDTPVAFDFEDCLHNWHSPLVDLAMALERFVLVRCADDTQALLLGRALFDAYRQHQPQLDWSAHGLSDILRALSVRALLLLCRRHAARQPVAESEWDKFLWLFEQAGQRRPLLEALAQP